MKVPSRIVFSVALVLLLGCGKSRQLASLLPDAPEGWTAEGGATNKDVSGVGHSSARSYKPANSASGVQRVTVQILLAEKSASQKSVQEMSIEKEGQFKERKDVGGFPAYESFPLPSDNTHSLDILPKNGTYVSIMAAKGGPGWDNGEARKAAVSAFINKIDLKKIAALQ
jgi:hypothetical protein